MERFDFESWFLVAIVLLGSVAQLVQALFRTLRIVVREYYGFIAWLEDVQQARRDRFDGLP